MVDIVHFQSEIGPLHCDICKSFLYRSRVRCLRRKAFPYITPKNDQNMSMNFRAREIFFRVRKKKYRISAQPARQPHSRQIQRHKEQKPRFTERFYDLAVNRGL
jgi:hypothetical protein